MRFIYYRDDKFYFILKGEISLVKRSIGKIGRVTEENTLGEEAILDKRYTYRKESTFVESLESYLFELSPENFIKIKEMLYEMGLKKDFLMIESTLRRNFMLKKNFRL